MKKRITAAATTSSRTTSGQTIPKITASTAAGIHPKANPKKPYVSVQNPHTPTNVAAAVIQVPASYQSRMSANPGDSAPRVKISSLRWFPNNLNGSGSKGFTSYQSPRSSLQSFPLFPLKASGSRFIEALVEFRCRCNPTYGSLVHPIAVAVLAFIVGELHFFVGTSRDYDS